MNNDIAACIQNGCRVHDCLHVGIENRNSDTYSRAGCTADADSTGNHAHGDLLGRKDFDVFSGMDLSLGIHCGSYSIFQDPAIPVQSL